MAKQSASGNSAAKRGAKKTRGSQRKAGSAARTRPRQSSTKAKAQQPKRSAQRTRTSGRAEGHPRYARSERQPEIESGSVIAVLENDHRKVIQMLSELESTGSEEKRAHLLDQIRKEIQIHTQLEEEIFYPAVQQVLRSKEERKLVHEAREEHNAVDMVLPRLRDPISDVEVFQARVKVVKDMVEHHIDQERNEMFPEARRRMSREQLRELGEQVEERRASLQKGWVETITSLVTG